MRRIAPALKVENPYNNSERGETTVIIKYSLSLIVYIGLTYLTVYFFIQGYKKYRRIKVSETVDFWTVKSNRVKVFVSTAIFL